MPGSGLEHVLYRLEVARSGSTDAGFELNLNSGRSMGFRFDHVPSAVEDFWFAIDSQHPRREGDRARVPPGGRRLRWRSPIAGVARDLAHETQVSTAVGADHDLPHSLS